MNRAIFLDRDGVLNKNRSDYVKSIAELVFIRPAVAATRLLADTSFKVILVTNQSGIGRGIIPVATAHAINQRLCEEVAAHGGRIDAVYMCVHHPDDGCDCRKPRPGMLLQASAEHEIDLSRSYFVGDAMTDYQAGIAAGVTPLMVRTGRGVEQLKLMAPHNYQPTVFDDLAEVIDWIVLNAADV